MALRAEDVVQAVDTAARVIDAVKEYGKGANVVRALDGVTVGFPAASDRDHGSVGPRESRRSCTASPAWMSSPQGTPSSVVSIWDH